MTGIDALFDEAQKVAASDTQLRTIGDLIQEERALVGEMETLEEAFKAAKEKRRAILYKRLPEMMLGAGLREFKTNDGMTAKIVFLTDGALGSPKTPEEFAEREAKIDCIIDHGGGEIVKQTVTIDFPKEHAADADVIKERLEKLFATKKWGRIPVKIGRERTVNHQTLGAWIKERMASGDVEEQLPPTFFERVGIWFGEGAKIVMPRKPKGAA